MTTTAFTNGVTLTDAAWFNDTDTVSYAGLTTVAGTNTITATGPASFTAYASLQRWILIPAATNTGATTLNISSKGARNIFWNGAALAGGELKIGIPTVLVDDGTRLQIVGPQLTGLQGSSLVLIQTQTPSGAATVDFTTGITSTYDEYVVKLIVTPATDATDLYFRLSQDGGSTFIAGTGYNHGRMANTDGGAIISTGATGAAQILLAASLGNAAAKRLVGEFRFFEPADTTHTKLVTWQVAYVPSGNTISQVAGGGNYTADQNAYNAIRFLMSSGNISGTVSLYGVRKA